MSLFRIGIDNYGLDPLGLKPMEILDWAAANGAEGVHFSGLSAQSAGGVDTGYLKDLQQKTAARGMYIEWGGAQHLPFDTTTWERRDILEINRKAAQEASLLGTRVLRSCSGGFMRWSEDNPPTDTLLIETAAALQAQKSLLEDLEVTLAIETHFEFTTHELLRIFDMCGAEPGGYLGVCFDTMNVIAMLEDPLEALERIRPWIVSTHIKDGGLFLSPEGMRAFPARIGDGVIDFFAIAERLADQTGAVALSVEDHGGCFILPLFDPAFMEKFPDLSLEEFTRLLHLAQKSQEKSGRGELHITERKDWPGICELRMRQNLKNLRKILQT